MDEIKMTVMTMAIAALGFAGCSGDEVPSCQEAITNFYGAGCAFLDLSNDPPTAYSLNFSIADCKQVNANVPDRCQSYFDDYMFCLDDVSSLNQCASCTGEQDRLFGCQ